MKKRIQKYLKRKKEKVIVDFYIRKYNRKNFYIALVYSKKVDLYKILYIPVDLVEGKIDEYACYQFIDIINVEYILGLLTGAKKFPNKVDVSNKKTDLYNIEINMNLLKDKYEFKATQFIPRDWPFLFDLLATVFGYLPHIISWLCEDMLTLFKDSSEELSYQEILEVQLLRDEDEKIDKLFPGKLLDFKNISFLESINNKFYAIISGHIVIIDYNKSGIIGAYCDCDDYADYVHTVIYAIREEIERPFSKVKLVDRELPSIARFYLCYGANSKNLKVISKGEELLLSKDLYDEGLLTFTSDENNFEEKFKGKKKDA